MHRILSLMMIFSSLASAEEVVDVQKIESRLRQRPALDFPVVCRVNVQDYGARPDDRNALNSMAIYRALTDIREKGEPAELYFPQGTYYLQKLPADVLEETQIPKVNGAICIYSQTNLIFNGNGSVFIINENPDNPPLPGFIFAFWNENLIIKNCTIDYDPLPFIQLQIEEVNVPEKCVVASVMDGFTGFERKDLTDVPAYSQIIHLKDPSGRFKDGSVDHLLHGPYEKLDESRYKIQFGTNALAQNDFDVGDILVRTSRHISGPHIKCIEDRKITLYNITSYAAQAVHVLAHNCEAPSFINVKLLPGREGQVQCSGADGFHLGDNDPGAYFENCHVEGTGDDAVNSFMSPLVIVEVKDPQSFVVLNGASSFDPGDQLYSYDFQTGDYYGPAVVTGKAGLSGGRTRIDIDREIGGIFARVDFSGFADSWAALRHPQNKLLCSVVNPKYNQGLVIRNSTFKNIRRFGLLLQSQYALIESNTYENVTVAPVCFNGPFHREGLFPSHVMIRGNTFSNCNFAVLYEPLQTPADRSDISVQFKQMKKSQSNEHEFSDWMGMKNVLIENNVFYAGRYNRPGLFLQGVQGCLVRGNTFYPFEGPDAQEWIDGYPALMRNAAELMFESNLIVRGGNAYPLGNCYIKKAPNSESTPVWAVTSADAAELKGGGSELVK